MNENEKKEEVIEGTTEATIEGTTTDTTPTLPPIPTPTIIPAATPSDPVTSKLQEMGVSADVISKIITDLGATTVEDLFGLTEDDLVACGMKKLPARKLVNGFKPPEPTVTKAAEPTSANMVSFDILPSIPNDESWLKALKAGGVLKVEQSTVISAIRAMLAHRAGLYTIPQGLVKLMERFAEDNVEQVSPEYFRLRKELTRSDYAELFEAIPGLDGSYVTEARKKRLFERIDEYLWPAIIAFYEQLKSWYETWTQGAANPMVLMSAFMGAVGGGGIMPPNMMQPPDTGALHDYADAFNEAVNKVFAGTGVQIASALAFEATRIRETLENPSLPGMMGVPNRDQMLRQLGVAVSATYPRLEVNVTRFALSILRAEDQASGNEEIMYFATLYTLGSQIPWNQLTGDEPVAANQPTGIGGTGRGSKL